MGASIQNQSSTVSSSQSQIHPRLEETVARHLATTWRGKPHQASLDVFKRVCEWLGDDRKQIILDSGCGTGESTLLIASNFPECRVIGIDRSEKRLGRLAGSSWNSESCTYTKGNAIWVRAELATFWFLAAQANWRLHRHFLLYPNPWPKPGHLQRRWHGHAVFPTLLALGGHLELRSNWLIYVREFQQAIKTATGLETDINRVGESSISTPFEDKYRRSGHSLYSVSLDLAAVV